MLGAAMGKIIKRLEKKGVNLSKIKALDIFAREGDWQTKVYADKVKSLDAWEIDAGFKKGLHRNLPKAKIKITDSIKEINNKSNFSKYDFIVIDNPQCCYGPGLKYCEHFEVMPQIAKLLDKEGLLIFNINKQPFDFEKLPLWQRRREKFYGLKDTSRIPVEFLLNFYEKLFLKINYKTQFRFNVIRGTKDRGNYLHYLVFYIKKND